MMKVIGLAQSIRAIEEGKADRIFLAADADEAIIEKVQKACTEANVPVEMVSSKKQLGKESGIEVAAAVVCQLK
jgi:large subunit ribosomal protein L7A